MVPALVAFAKAPIPGHVKTRLAEEVGPERAARAYERLLLALMSAVAGRLPGWSVNVYVARGDDRLWFKDRWPGLDVHLQRGANLGDRIHSAFADLFQRGHQRVVVVGTDIPDLTTAIIQEAAELLWRSPVVVGPAQDGGYYLIGQRAPGADLFSGVEWSSERVYAQTMERALACGLSVARLPMLYDVDTLEDWHRYRSERPPKPEHSLD